MNLRYLYISVVLIALCFSGILYLDKLSDYEHSRNVISLRNLGHQILLASHDSTSRVLPVDRSKDGQFRLTFEKPFAIMPDSLVKTVKRVMKGNDISTDYVVNVFNSQSNELVYGFAVSETSANIVPCLGRLLPAKEYAITVIPKTKTITAVSRNKFPLFALLMVAGIGGSAIFGRQKIKTLNSKGAQSICVKIGAYSFFPEKHILEYGSTSEILTPKETKLLGIFARDLNIVIDRNQLLKEGWEDEGVITQRSLDMYVSKLRKKLKQDPSIHITNVHGKGYRLSTTV